MRSVIVVVDIILNLMFWILIVQAILSWLLAFNVVNARNQVVSMVWGFTRALTEPLLRPIRSVVKPFNGMDLSPLILILLIFFARDLMWRYIYPNVI